MPLIRVMSEQTDETFPLPADLPLTGLYQSAGKQMNV